MSDEVLVERRGAVQVIIINRPQARNALNRAVATGVRDAADELDADPALRVGVLTGALDEQAAADRGVRMQGDTARLAQLRSPSGPPAPSGKPAPGQ